MANMSGLGAFAQGLAGGITNLSGKVMQGAQLEQEQQKSKRQEEHLKLTSDIAVVKDIYPMIIKSKDPVAAMKLATEAGETINSPFFKSVLIAGATSNEATNKALKAAVTRISDIISNPTKDAYKRARLELVKLETDESIGKDHPVVAGLKAQIDISEKADNEDNIPIKTKDLILGLETRKQMEQAKQGTLKMPLQQNPEAMVEAMKASDRVEENRAWLSIHAPKELENIVGQYELNKPAEGIKKPEITGNVIKDKESPTGWSYADKHGNIMTKGAPMPSVYKPEKGDKASMTDIKSAYSMEANTLKNEMMIDMTPDEQANVANQPTENIMALILSGRIGKSLPPDKKEYYKSKSQEIQGRYDEMTGQVMGRKGVKVSKKTTTQASAPETYTVGKEYTDAQGRKAKYLGKGKWQLQ